MNVSATPDNPATNGPRIGRSKSRIAGIVLTVLVTIFLLVDGIAKLIKPQSVIEGSLRLGYQDKHIVVMGILLLVGVALWTIPRTAVIGAIYLTGYFGGAVASNFRADQPVASTVLSGVYMAIFVWVAMILRRPELRIAILGR